MKRYLIVVGWCLCALLTAQTSIGFSSNDPKPLKDYRLPEWGYSQGKIGFSYAAIGNDRKSSNGKDNYSRTDLRLLPSYTLFRESERMALSFTAHGDGRFSDYKSTYENVYNRSTSKGPQYDIDITGFGSWKFYEASGTHWGANSELSYDRNWREYKSQLHDLFNNPPNEYKSSNKSTQQRLNGNVAFLWGFGRIRNVTPVIRALRLSERMHAVNKDMSQESIDKAAEQFTRYSAYTAKYDRPDKYFWESLGDPLNGLSAFESRYVNEVFNEAIGNRSEGYEIDFGLRGNSWNFRSKYEDQGTYSGDTAKFHEKVYFTGPQVSGAYYSNYSLSGQVGVDAKINYDWALNKKDNPLKNVFYLDITLSHLYNITDRILVTSSFRYQNTQAETSSEALVTNKKFKSSAFDLSSSVYFFIENRISLSGNANWRRITNKPESSLGDYSPLGIDTRNSIFGYEIKKRTNWYLSASLNYYFDRSLR